MTEKMISKKEYIEILVNEHNWDESLLKAMTLDVLKAILESAEALKEAKASVEKSEPEAEKKIVLKETKREIKEFNDDDMIEVMNGATQRLIYVGELDGYYYDFARYGDREEMPYKELRLMARRQRKFLENRYIIILDEDAIASLRLGNIQTGIYTTEDLHEILLEDKKSRINSVLNSSEATQQALLRMAVSMKKNSQLRLVKIVDAIENHFDVRLDDLEVSED